MAKIAPKCNKVLLPPPTCLKIFSCNIFCQRCDAKSDMHKTGSIQNKQKASHIIVAVPTHVYHVDYTTR